MVDSTYKLGDCHPKSLNWNPKFQTKFLWPGLIFIRFELLYISFLSSFYSTLILKKFILPGLIFACSL